MMASALVLAAADMAGETLEGRKKRRRNEMVGEARRGEKSERVSE